MKTNDKIENIIFPLLNSTLLGNSIRTIDVCLPKGVVGRRKSDVVIPPGLSTLGMNTVASSLGPDCLRPTGW